MKRTIVTLTTDELRGIIREELRSAPIGTENKWMTTGEVLDMLKVGRTTLHYRVKEGKIHQYKDPGSNRVYYNREELHAYLQSCKVEKP